VIQKVRMGRALLMDKYDEIARPNARVTRMFLKVSENGMVWIEDAELEIEVPG
jgi:hypothetical protein